MRGEIDVPIFLVQPILNSFKSGEYQAWYYDSIDNFRKYLQKIRTCLWNLSCLFVPRENNYNADIILSPLLRVYSVWPTRSIS